MISNRLLTKQLSAWLPIVMSCAALALVVGYALVSGVSRQPQGDEGTAARCFQLLLVGQVPVVAFFAIRWLPRLPKEALQVLIIQVVAVLVPVLLVLYLEI